MNESYATVANMPAGLPYPAPRRSLPAFLPSSGKLPENIGHVIVESAAKEIARLAEACQKDPAGAARGLLLIERFAAMARDAVSLTAAGAAEDVLPSPHGINMPMAPSPGSETFGATSIRELVAMFSKKKPEDLVLAIAEAKKQNLPDVARALEEQLGVKPSPPKSSKKQRAAGALTRAARKRSR